MMMPTLTYMHMHASPGSAQRYTTRYCSAHSPSSTLSSFPAQAKSSSRSCPSTSWEHCYGRTVGPLGASSGLLAYHLVVFVLFSHPIVLDSEAAHKAFASSPFFRAWDPAALAVYVECGLYETPSGTVRLKTRPVQEAVTFADHQVPPETFELLAHLDERVELRWVVPGKNDE